MTRVFDNDGKAITVSIVETGPCFVSQIKTAEHDGYDALQIAYGTVKHITKPSTGHLKKLYNENPSAKDKNFRNLKEVHIPKEEIGKFKVGDEIKVDIFNEGDRVDVHAVSKGKGFQGTVKRHHFTTGPKTHGSDNYRQPGSIGATFPQHTIKGRRMSGHMGHENVTVQNLKVREIMPEKNLIFLEGPVPGIKDNLICIEGK